MGGLSGSGRIRCRASHVTGAMREPPGREDSSLWHDRILTLFRKGGAGRTRERRGGLYRRGQGHGVAGMTRGADNVRNLGGLTHKRLRADQVSGKSRHWGDV
jgi:hypothetical protein